MINSLKCFVKVFYTVTIYCYTVIIEIYTVIFLILRNSMVEIGYMVTKHHILRYGRIIILTAVNQ